MSDVVFPKSHSKAETMKTTHGELNINIEKLSKCCKQNYESVMKNNDIDT